MKYFYVGFFKASIYFYLFEDFSIVLSIVVFSTGILPQPEKNPKLTTLHDDQRNTYPETPNANLTGPNFIFRYATLYLKVLNKGVIWRANLGSCEVVR